MYTNMKCSRMIANTSESVIGRVLSRLLFGSAGFFIMVTIKPIFRLSGKYPPSNYALKEVGNNFGELSVYGIFIMFITFPIKTPPFYDFSIFS
jgi:hypothetical protein